MDAPFVSHLSNAMVAKPSNRSQRLSNLLSLWIHLGSDPDEKQDNVQLFLVHKSVMRPGSFLVVMEELWILMAVVVTGI